MTVRPSLSVLFGHMLKQACMVDDSGGTSVSMVM